MTSFSSLAERSAEGPMTTAKIAPIMTLSVRPARILRTPGGTMQPEGESSIRSGKLTKETTMNHATMTTLENTGITGAILTNKISASTVTGKGNEKENERDLTLTVTETMRGGPLNGVRVQFTCGDHRALEPPRHKRRDCLGIPREGCTAGPQTGAGAAAHCPRQGTRKLTSLVWNAIQKMKRQTKNELLILKEERERDD